MLGIYCLLARCGSQEIAPLAWGLEWDAEKSHSGKMLEKILIAGCSKTFRYKAPEIPRSETYMVVRRNDEG
jgi:hypothetical protein